VAAKERSAFATLSESLSFASRHGLRPMHEVRDEWQRRSGERLSRARVFQILKAAEEKMAKALRSLDPGEPVK
jgi:hypothetical protein